MKLVDADKLREMPLPTQDEFKPTDRNMTDFLCGMDWAGKFMQESPSIDPVHAVGACFCKECVHFEPREEVDGESWTGFCKYGDHHTDERDFCSRGKKKEGGV